MTSYPINLTITGKNVLVVGAGKTAYRKLKRLIANGAEITLISPTLIAPVKELVQKGEINYQQREFIASDIKEQFLIIAATDKKEVNQRIGELALQEGSLVNVIDNLELSNFTLPAVLKQGDLLLTVATNGNLPALAKKIRQELEAEFGEEFAFFLDLMRQVRPLIIAEIEEEANRRELFHKLADLRLLELLAWNQKLGLDYIKQLLPDKVVGQLIIDNLQLTIYN